jgi:dihydrofolate synthase/folylpolyglutamate synthase
MTYAEALRYLDGLIHPARPQRPYAEEKLARMRRLLAALGDPQHGLRTVLVAGTKGKGSTAAMLAAVLRAHGLEVGLTVKPHLVDYRERIRVDGRQISAEQVAALVARLRAAVRAAAEDGRDPPTYVEATVALALMHFAAAHVDIAVVEVGIGGRLDATNVLDPQVSVITPISYDHTEILGTTLAAIAGEKAGIIRPGVPVVSAPQPEEARAVIERVAAERGAPLVLVGRDIEVEVEESSLAGVRATVRGVRGRYPIRIPLLGRHQAINAGTAIAAAELLAGRGLAGRDATLAAPGVRRGIASVRWPARVELVATSPYTIIDVGHNPASVAALRVTLEELLAGRRLVLVFGMLATKDYRTVAAIIAPLASAIVTTTPDNPHALPASALADEVRRYTAQVVALPDRREAVERGRALAGPDDVLVITGSFYLVGQAREWLRPRRRKAPQPARR